MYHTNHGTGQYSLNLEVSVNYECMVYQWCLSLAGMCKAYHNLEGNMLSVKVPWDLSVECDFARSKSLSLDKISSDR